MRISTRQYCFNSSRIDVELEKPTDDAVLIPTTLPRPKGNGTIVQVTGYAPWVNWASWYQKHVFKEIKAPDLDIKNPKVQKLLLKGAQFMRCLVCDLVLPLCVVKDPKETRCPKHNRVVHIAKWYPATSEEALETLQAGPCIEEREPTL